MNSPFFLQFSLFIDWFNLLGNKLSGKLVSLGILALTCLNLPPFLRHKKEYIYLAGMIPAPNQPNTTTINNVLQPLVDELLSLYRQINIQTCKFPQGQNITVALAALIGDIIATHKTAGFLSHSSNMFCSWCMKTKGNIDKMEMKRRQHKFDTQAISYLMRETKAISEHESLAKRVGVRWSELNRLPYWDPVRGVVLSVLHNWYKGVLQHHFCFCWGINGLSNCGFKESAVDAILDTSNNSISENEETPTIVELFNIKVKKKLISSIIEIVVPSQITHMPKQLGSAQNGKLKASEWHSLFAIHLPLVFLDILV
ncbi:hypothetical protein O181_028034 [Austropuccinia psidii MF-1]|uniref:Uncharacterized protein n=1 Tax=Austropuccinia psidii MF-1 TaxID=1389203 RepID=A0A9Q3H366_9BASI|nr:hypothetical protein [Austropuccinia psidii MF-1]